MVAIDSFTKTSPKRALFTAALLFLAELFAIGTLFKHGIQFTCLENWPAAACQAASGTLVAVYCVLGVGVLFWMLRPAPLKELTAQAGARRWPLAVNLVGTLVALVPVLFMQTGAGNATILPAFGFWTVGMGMMVTGILLYAAPLALWKSFLSQNALALIPILSLGAMAPFLASLIRPIWQLETVASATFYAVTWMLRVIGYTPEVDIDRKVIGANNFFIDVAPQCSGVEGLALVTLFVSIYLCMFRESLRFPRAFWLFPIGLAASLAFNVVRIAVLLIIGLEGNPELAIGGFHSHAGWLMFTLVALGIVMLAQNATVLQKPLAAAAPHGAAPVAGGTSVPLLRDPMAAHILPFAVFMFSALLAQAFAQAPSVVYPLRALAMAAALLLFLPLYRKMAWRIDPVAVAIGAAIGIMWVVIPVADVVEKAPYGSLTGALLIGWFIMRGLGTIVLVPIIEELFFRGYLETRLRVRDTLVWTLFASLVASGLFAALHDRWVEAFFAGLLFSYLVQRKGGRVVDAIIAHAVANALVYGAALVTGNLAII